MWDDIKVGCMVNRLLAGTVKMPLMVTEVSDTQIICGWWVFDRATGAEIDEDLGWGPYGSGSYLIKET